MQTDFKGIRNHRWQHSKTPACIFSTAKFEGRAHCSTQLFQETLFTKEYLKFSRGLCRVRHCNIPLIGSRLNRLIEITVVAGVKMCDLVIDLWANRCLTLVPVRSGAFVPAEEIILCSLPPSVLFFFTEAILLWPLPFSSLQMATFFLRETRTPQRKHSDPWKKQLAVSCWQPRTRS